MRLPILGAKPQTIYPQFKSAEASATIPTGAPVALVFNGTDDGLAGVLPSTAAAAKATGLFLGICQNSSVNGGVLPGQIGDVCAYGIVLNAKITLATRATSTDSFASYASINTGVALVVDTVGNGLTISASVSAITALPFAVLGQTIASGASSASTSSNTATAVTAAVKAFIRAM